MAIRINGDNTVASPAITSASDTDTGLQFGTNEVKVVNGNLDITDGNLIVASGHGIDFSATADGTGTTTSELLDDYEEGTWTPEYTCSTTAPSITYNVQIGTYTKVGNLVTVGWRIRTTGPMASAGAGDIYVTNLPFVIGNTDFDQRGVAQIWSSNWDPGFNPNAVMGRKGEDNVQLTTQTATNSAPTTDLGGDFDNISATAFDTSSGTHNQTYCTLTYFVD